MSKAKVVVLGSFVVDLMMRAYKLPLAGETLKGNCFMLGAGGKGSNQGVAASKSGSWVTMITKIGADEFAEVAKKSFVDNGMDCDYVYIDSDNPTGAALIMVDDKTSQNMITVYLGACNNITDEDIEQARDRIEKADVFLTQLETNQSAVIKAIDIAKASGVKVILNPAPAEAIPDSLYKKIDYFTPNETEAGYFCGIEINNEEDVRRAGEFFINKGIKNVVFTLGSKGACLYNKDKVEFFKPIKIEAVDTTGAGDAFNGGLATALAEGKCIEDAIRFASTTAGLSVTKTGTACAMPTRAEIDKMMI